MRLSILVPITIAAAQAFQNTFALINHNAAARSLTFPPKKLFTRGDSNKRPTPYSRPGSSQGRNERPRFTRSQSGSENGVRTPSTNRYESPSQLQGQHAGQGRSQNSEPGGGQSQDERDGQSSQRQPFIRGQTRNQSGDLRLGQSLGQGQSPNLGALARGRAAGPEALTRSRVASPQQALSQHQPLSPSPSASLTQSSSLESNRFPSPRPGLWAPDRNKPVQIHTAIDGPARVTGYLGQNPTQNEHMNIPMGASLNKLWSDPYQAEVYVKTFEGGHGVNRAWAAGGRRASIRTDAQPRTLAMGSYIGVGGPVSDLKTQHEDGHDRIAGGYIKASTRSYENHVGVDSMYHGAGLTVLRASNSKAGTESRPSSLSRSELGSGSDGEVSSEPPSRQRH